MYDCGVTVYPDYQSIEEIENYLNECKKLGYTRLFTCMQLGDYGFEKGKNSSDPIFKQLFKLAKDIGLITSADITDKVFKDYGASTSNLSKFKDLGLDILRLDGGFTSDQIIEMAKNEYNIKIELNASHILSICDLDNFFNQLEIAGVKERILTCFNFYPRTDTGQTLDDINDTIKKLSKYQVSISAFIASQACNSLLHKYGHGIPTLEKHRYLSPKIAAQELSAIGINHIIFGDSFASSNEIKDLIKYSKSDYIELFVVFNDYVSEETKEKICSTVFMSRGDQPSSVIRVQQLRGFKTKSNNCVKREYLSVTIDNDLAGRYSGEIQIVIKDLPADATVNVIGKITNQSELLLEYIKGEKNKFKFKSV